MRINWNWGTKLLAAMIIFMLFIVILVYMSMKQDYYLVEKDYYPKALEYQDRIDKKQNALQLGEGIRIDQVSDRVVFTFPASLDPAGISGSIAFYRPSDETMDVVFDMMPDTSGKQACDIGRLPGGKYIVKIEYEVNGKGYYQEEPIFLEMR